MLSVPGQRGGLPSAMNKSLQLSDEDPYDYARAIRVFKETKTADISFRMYAAQDNTGILSVDVTDQYGNRCVRLSLNDKAEMIIDNGGTQKVIKKYDPKSWYNVQLKINATIKGYYDLYINGEKLLNHTPLAEAVKSVERISFRTGAYRNTPTRTTPNVDPVPPLPGADEKVAKATFYIDDVVIK